uniref:Uncharacterized protein n=1 Tax=Timema shepardi TaxID=629360 RepID=A0A7R9APN1_TIMSH|nr:unnamed protein product [Timema shepardi]
MRDIRYKWNEGPNSVGVSNEVSLPQFKVLGHRQRAMEISLTTGTSLERWTGRVEDWRRVAEGQVWRDGQEEYRTGDVWLRDKSGEMDRKSRASDRQPVEEETSDDDDGDDDD